MVNSVLVKWPINHRNTMKRGIQLTLNQYSLVTREEKTTVIVTDRGRQLEILLWRNQWKRCIHNPNSVNGKWVDILVPLVMGINNVSLSTLNIPDDCKDVVFIPLKYGPSVIPTILETTVHVSFESRLTIAIACSMRYHKSYHNNCWSVVNTIVRLVTDRARLDDTCLDSIFCRFPLIAAASTRAKYKIGI